MTRNIKIGSFFVSILLLSLSFGCKKSTSLTAYINAEISRNPSMLKSLTNGYEFKHFKNATGRDYSKPIQNNLIIILKNDLTKNIDISKINTGKAILMDSTDICNLSYSHDENQQIMRSFLNVVSSNTDKKYKLELKNWVPQYIRDTYICIEFEN